MCVHRVNLRAVIVAIKMCLTTKMVKGGYSRMSLFSLRHSW